MHVNPNHRLNGQQIIERNNQKKIFPNQISLGSFTPHSTIVEVCCFRTSDVTSAIANDNLLSVRKDIQVLCHEMTHWFDFFGTLWGRIYIKKICKAYRALYAEKESEFINFMDLFDQDRKILTPDYYRFSKNPVSNYNINNPWKMVISSGAEIDPFGKTREDMPLILLRYEEAPNGDMFARQPISVGSLLEVRAIASEIKSGISAIETDPNTINREVEKGILKKEIERISYDHNLIEYNAAAHVVHQQSRSSNLLDSYRLAATLSFIALNMDKKSFDNLREPKQFSAFGKRNRQFKKNFDRGYAFACMAFNGGVYEGDDNLYIGKCLVNSNLGTAEEILIRASDHMYEPIWFKTDDPVSANFFEQSILGKNIIDAHRGFSNFLLDFSNLLGTLRFAAPPFMDEEANFVELAPNRIGRFTPEFMHDSAQSLQDVTKNLLTGCRGI